MRYTLCDNFLTLWFRFFFKYQAFVENGALKQLARLIERDINILEGFMLERYFERKLRETGDYTRIGKYWDRKGENEIDLIAVNEIDKVAWVYEVKRNANKYDEAILRAKVDNLLQNCSELRSYKFKSWLFIFGRYVDNWFDHYTGIYIRIKNALVDPKT